MKTSVALLACGLLLTAAAQPALPSLRGHWEGTLVMPTSQVPVTIDLDKNANGVWIGNFGMPSQNVSGLLMEQLVVDGALVRFMVIEAASMPHFQGKLKSDGTLELSLVQRSSTFAATSMRRTGEPKVVVPPASPAVGVKFEGDYEGLLVAPNGSMKTLLHLHNQPDKTVLATFDSPLEGAFGMALVNVVAKDAELSFTVHITKGAFRGKLSADATELAGSWTQSGATMPITLKKIVAKK